MDIINREFSQTQHNVMTVTSRCGSIHRTFKVEEKSDNGKFKCRVIKSEAWYYPGSSYKGEARYDKNEFHLIHESEILKALNEVID